MKNVIALLLLVALASCHETTRTETVVPAKPVVVEATKAQRHAEHYRFIKVGEDKGTQVFISEVQSSLQEGFGLIGDARMQQIEGRDYYTQTMFRQE